MRDTVCSKVLLTRRLVHARAGFNHGIFNWLIVRGGAETAERHPEKGGENVQHRLASTTVQDASKTAETVNTVKRSYNCDSNEHLQRCCPERRKKEQ
ncbi:hypothetical protein E2320_002109 [Naja naja]|nr:hypothetical protein E2320_002109 [Naja naja]